MLLNCYYNVHIFGPAWPGDRFGGQNLWKKQWTKRTILLLHLYYDRHIFGSEWPGVGLEVKFRKKLGKQNIRY